MKKRPFHARRRSTKRQSGAAAVELALLLPILVPFLMLGFFTISIFWHYTMAQKAAQDAARYLSTVPVAELLTPAQATAAGLLAREIVQREIAEISPDARPFQIDTFCIWDNVTRTCGGGAATLTPPTAVRVGFTITMFDPSGYVDTGWLGLQITADHTMRYVGN